MKGPFPIEQNFFWGKLKKEDEKVVGWHPLIDHCADVAACCEALLNLPLMEKRLAKLAGGTLTEITKARLTVICALHDIGKFNRGFQRKATKDPAIAGHVIEGLALLDPRGSLRFEGLKALDVQSMRGWCDDRTLSQILTASIAHHGRPYSISNCSVNPDLWRGEPLSGLQSLSDAVKKWFPQAFETGTPLPSSPKFVHAFCGLVTLADWLGSDTDAFPYSTVYDYQGMSRLHFSRERASLLLREIGLDTRKARAALPPNPNFNSISRFSPRAAQKAVLNLPEESEGSIAVLEAETGSGKTEAALARYIRLFAAGEVDGMYFAVPTRTAATQLHQRITDAVKRAFPNQDARPPVSLAVPGYLRVDDKRGRKLSKFDVLWNDNGDARWRFRGWAAENSKRYLSGAVVVGTVDQILLSALQVDHTHLRATSLLRLLLVVDEVHASDAYMTTLLKSVLKRHRDAGGHALLLSATLGGEARAKLLGVTPPSLNEARATPYPQLSYIGQTAAAIDIPTENQTRIIQTEIWPMIDDPMSIATKASAAAREGARVLIIRNTVTGCLAVQKALESLAEDVLFRCRSVAAPHHSRFAEPDRRLLDTAVEGAFGKNSKTTGVVAVATQTVEQSLDLDADLMITDLCPMDVFLQRVGRLHRHARSRPPAFNTAQVVVLTPEERNIESHIGRRIGHGLGSVYADLRVIEATWQSLEADAILHIPDQCRDRVEMTVHSQALAEIAKGEKWEEHVQDLVGVELGDTCTARLNILNWDIEIGKELFRDGRVPTRLGDSDRLIDLGELKPRGPFGQIVRELKIPGWLASGIQKKPKIKLIQQDGEGFDFSIDEVQWRYGRHGLIKTVTS